MKTSYRFKGADFVGLGHRAYQCEIIEVDQETGFERAAFIAWGKTRELAIQSARKLIMALDGLSLDNNGSITELNGSELVLKVTLTSKEIPGTFICDAYQEIQLSRCDLEPDKNLTPEILYKGEKTAIERISILYLEPIDLIVRRLLAWHQNHQTNLRINRQTETKVFNQVDKS